MVLYPRKYLLGCQAFFADRTIEQLQPLDYTVMFTGFPQCGQVTELPGFEHDRPLQVGKLAG